MASFIFRIISESVLILILLTIRCGDTREIELDCVPSIRVPRNTVWNAPENETLMINCTITIESHCGKILSASWCKMNENECRPMTHSNHTATGWRIISENQRMFFLIFWNLSMQNAGLYRCQTYYGPVFTTGHAIMVNVTENRETEQSVVKHFYLLYFAVILVLSVPVLIKTVYRKEHSLRDKETLTTVFYEEAEDSSLQE